MNPRKVLQRYLGNRETIARSRAGGWLGRRLHDPNLWHLGRRSVAGGVGVGFSLAFIPLPVHMLVAVPVAIMLRVNLPVALAAVWIANPFTIAPMFLFALHVGLWVTGREAHIATHFEPSLAGMSALLGEIWYPLLIGCLLCGASAGAIGNFTVRWLWRAYLLHRRRQRRQRRVPRITGP